MRLTRRLNHTYQRLYRDRHIKAKDSGFSDAEYRLWDLFKALYDWDDKHLESFGEVSATDRELANILGWSAAKVCRTRNRLIKRGFIKKVGTSQLTDYKVNGVAQLQQATTRMKKGISPMQQESAPVQQNQTYHGNSAIVSYKDKSSLVRSDEEYEKMWEEEGKPESFTPNDMKWI